MKTEVLFLFHSVVKRGAGSTDQIDLGIMAEPELSQPPPWVMRGKVCRIESVGRSYGTDLMRNHGDWVQRYVETRLQEWHEGNARRRMAALRICRFLRDATCNPVYAACRRRLEAEPMDMTTG